MPPKKKKPQGVALDFYGDAPVSKPAAQSTYYQPKA